MEELPFPRRTAAGLLALLAWGGCARPDPPPPPNVLLVVVDTLRQDRLGPYGYTARPTT